MKSEGRNLHQPGYHGNHVMSWTCDPLTLHSPNQGYTIYARLRLAALVAEMNGFLNDLR